MVVVLAIVVVLIVGVRVLGSLRMTVAIVVVVVMTTTWVSRHLEGRWDLKCQYSA
ncbi:hypothetical protein BKA67DRAFT_572836 [Truncatella angustata]|uniref:Uncharacterized protein n=1 Tax=Truncatella angustata TaxID=152316 RepID=A0A9P8UHF8_9PEZI|nr:uncharacterized protein BKA67DRAFT_572836 [Truncatella angustata]KAH6652077.1 hypothetical protein BKA67DRAFT_572836 [Truncatella angustata]